MEGKEGRGRRVVVLEGSDRQRRFVHLEPRSGSDGERGHCRSVLVQRPLSGGPA